MCVASLQLPLQALEGNLEFFYLHCGAHIGQWEHLAFAEWMLMETKLTQGRIRPVIRPTYRP